MLTIAQSPFIHELWPFLAIDKGYHPLPTEPGEAETRELLAEELRALCDRVDESMELIWGYHILPWG